MLMNDQTPKKRTLQEEAEFQRIKLLVVMSSSYIWQVLIAILTTFALVEYFETKELISNMFIVLLYIYRLRLTNTADWADLPNPFELMRNIERLIAVFGWISLFWMSTNNFLFVFSIVILIRIIVGFIRYNPNSSHVSEK